MNGSGKIIVSVYIPHFDANSKKELMIMADAFINDREEGIVVKNPKSLPSVGKSFDWMRIVGLESVEYRVVAVHESEKRPGFMGSIELENGQRVGSGFDDAERKKYLRDPGAIIGKWATIMYKKGGYGADSLRQPIFKGIRWDI